MGVLLLALLGGGGAWMLLSGDAEDVDLAPAPEPTPTEATEAPPEESDIEVRLTWSSHADLDLEVVDPEGDWVSHAATEVPSGGLLEADANGNCEATTDRPSEHVRWPERAAPTGEFLVQVSYALECEGGEGPQDFGIVVLIDGETAASFNDLIAPGEVLGLLQFSYPGATVEDLRERAEEEQEEEAEAAIATVEDLPSGLFCRDIAPQGFAYWEAVAYWELEGRPTRMDASNNGIPCETIYPADEVRSYWGDLYPGSTGSPVPPGGLTSVYNLPSGLFCRDLRAMGYDYFDAALYWEIQGFPSRMDASRNNIPCQTVYPADEVRAYWGGNP